jgi:hypothetical protein
MCLGYRLALFEIKAILLALGRDPRTGESTGEVVMDVKVVSTFAGLLQPHIKDGEKAGMGGV